jgi:hypothetical protein
VQALADQVAAQQAAAQSEVAQPAPEVTPVAAPSVAPVTPSVEAVAAPAPTPVAPTVAAPATPVVETPVAPKVEKPIEVKTTVSLEDLEKNLEEEKNAPHVESDFSKRGAFNKGKNRRPHQISDKEVEHIKPTDVPANGANAMPIYSQEELDAIAKEEEESDGKEEGSEEVDIDQYDKYYDDDDKK